MSNIRQQVDLIEEALKEFMQGQAPDSETEYVLNMLGSKLNLAERLLKEGGDSNSPICCYGVEENKISCGRHLKSGEWVDDIVAPLDEFVKHCKNCRETLSYKIPKIRGKISRAKTLSNIPLEDILEDLERFHHAQKKIDHLHTPITTNEELHKHAKEILPYAKSLQYYEGRFDEKDAKDVYFALGKEDTSTYQGSGRVRISQDSAGQITLYSKLAHEISHMLTGIGSDEAIVTMLGLETNAAMALDGNKNHEASAYRMLKNMLSYTAYIKARQTNQTGKWKKSMEKLFPTDLIDSTEEGYQKCFTEELEGAFLGSQLSCYTLTPYLALKEAQKEGRDYISKDDVYDKDINVPALMEILRKTLS